MIDSKEQKNQEERPDADGRTGQEKLFRILAAAGMILCVDVVFMACSSRSESIELVSADGGSEDGSGEYTGTEEESQNEAESVSAGDITGEEEAQEEEAQTEGAPAEGTQTEETQTEIYVYVCGAVCDPGVYALPENVRVYEAVEAAGGFADDADETYVNQALILSDQDRLYIPTCGETDAARTEAASAAGTEADAATYGITGADTAEETEAEKAAAEDAAAGQINLNTATQEELEILPGIGESKAAAIIIYREENGDFSSTEEIQNVSGIGEATYEKLKDLITVE